MDKAKVTPQEIYEVLEEQKKLLELKEKLSGLMSKVNHTINSLAVENLQLTQSIELNSDTEEQSEMQNDQAKSPPDLIISYNQQEQSEIINQQMIEIDLKPCLNNEEIESDEEEMNFY